LRGDRRSPAFVFTRVAESLVVGEECCQQRNSLWLKGRPTAPKLRRRASSRCRCRGCGIIGNAAHPRPNLEDSLKISATQVRHLLTVTAPAFFALLPGTLRSALVL